MGSSEVVLQVLQARSPFSINADRYFYQSNPMLSFKNNVSCLRRTNYVYEGMRNYSRIRRSHITINALPDMSCKCQRVESVSGSTADDGNGRWILGEANTSTHTVNNGVPKSANFHNHEVVQHLKHETGHLTSKSKSAAGGTVHDTLHKAKVESIEKEAWNLLRQSIVYYCANPVGTIAANDPIDSCILNYDQVFIRDFVPSGIAFLLKGDYDIVRNFILHTLQLQVIKYLLF